MMESIYVVYRKQDGTSKSDVFSINKTLKGAMEACTKNRDEDAVNAIDAPPEMEAVFEVYDAEEVDQEWAIPHTIFMIKKHILGE